MFKLAIIPGEKKREEELKTSLTRLGFTCLSASGEGPPLRQIIDLVLVDLNYPSARRRLKEFFQNNPEGVPPVIALVSREMLDTLGVNAGEAGAIGDFVVEPYDQRELVLRVKRLLQHTSGAPLGELIHCGDLVINLARCEVSLKGELVPLTFREYELLKFLASNKGRVFSREALLNRVWGYDYGGGDRTVDVHVRRLRSKLERDGSSFIETVRNIGYRFKSFEG